MKTRTRMNLAVLVCALSVATTCAAAEFVEGNIYVTIVRGEGCDFFGFEWIIEVDPETGETSIFADKEEDGLCNATGLAFTPTGDGLRVNNFGHESGLGYVQEFTADGSGTVVLDGDDGILRPNGVNSLAYDADGNLYVMDSAISQILRFPADGGPGEVFADSFDGVFGRGSIAFAPNGDLYYTSVLAGEVVRISPDGEGSLFDSLPAPTMTLTFDTDGALYVGIANNPTYDVYRYEGYDPKTRELVFSFEPQESAFGTVALTTAPDGETLYFVVPDPAVFPDLPGGRVFAIDPASGEYDEVANFLLLNEWGDLLIRGIAVKRDDIVALDCDGDANGDGTVDPLDSGFVLSRLGCPVNTGDPDCDASDQNSDGVVDPLDVGFVLARFGGC